VNFEPKLLDASNLTAMQEKWGGFLLDAGWTGIPNVLLKYAGPLGLDPAETLTLIYLMRFWWKPHDLPYPSISKTCLEMGVSRKTMTKKFASLREKGFIEIVKQGGKTKFSLDGLRKALVKQHNLRLEPGHANQVGNDLPF
jgi:hypothetical protein